MSSRSRKQALTEIKFPENFEELSPPSLEAAKRDEEKLLVNRPESKSFLATALTWHGSVSPRVMGRVAVVTLYSAIVQFICDIVPHVAVPITPFEYSGAVLALILVIRLNAGHDRWWEARKLWGSIVNQSRNLAVAVSAYGGCDREGVKALIRWTAAWPHVMRESLRQERSLKEVENLLGPQETAKIKAHQHMPLYVALKIAQLLQQLREKGMDPLAFHRAETERSLLIDAIGACERIRNTRMPLVLAIKTRRFIALFLLLLPFALVNRADWFTPLIVALAGYSFFSLDEIGAELQNPFSPRNLSHLPLNDITGNIEKDVLDLEIAAHK